MFAKIVHTRAGRPILKAKPDSTTFVWNRMASTQLHRNTFAVLLILITAAFLALLLPFFGAVFWAIVLGIVFAPLHARFLCRMPTHPTPAALATLLLCLLIVVLPLLLLTGALLRQASMLYHTVSTGNLDAGAYFAQIVQALPAWVVRLLERLGLGDFAAVRTTLSAASKSGAQLLAGQVVGVGQNALQFVAATGIMLYLLFFMLRDGEMLAAKIRLAVPLSHASKAALFATFVTVIRATVKGNVVVAASQGALGGTLFWFLGIQGALLWGVLMAFLSLVPAVGAALVWGPVALYYLATGAVGTGALVIGFGVLVIGLVDNLLRPILVGRDTHLPDYVVLLSSVGGIALFGLNGFVIGPVIAALFLSAWALFGGADAPTHPQD